MVLILDGNSVIGAHLHSDIGNLFCLGQKIGKDVFIHVCATCSELTSNINTMSCILKKLIEILCSLITLWDGQKIRSYHICFLSEFTKSLH